VQRLQTGLASDSFGQPANAEQQQEYADHPPDRVQVEPNSEGSVGQRRQRHQPGRAALRAAPQPIVKLTARTMVKASVHSTEAARNRGSKVG